MNKKQRAAYALALLLGIVTVFGGVNCPILTGGFSEVLADSASSPVIAKSLETGDMTLLYGYDDDETVGYFIETLEKDAYITTTDGAKWKFVLGAGVDYPEE